MAKYQSVTFYAAAREIASSGASANDKPPVGETVGQVVIGLVRHPIDRIVRRWNWKAAVLSSALRSSLFFSANLSAGLDAAYAAMLTEFVFRGITSGFYGGLTESFRHATPHWLASAAVMVILPICTHTTEFVVHWFRGTERLAASLTLSVAFTVISTLFNLFAMRRGVFIVGEGRGSLLADLRQMPRLIVMFLASFLCPSRRSI